MNDHPDHARRPFWLLRWPWVILLLIVAGVYYGSYYRHGINFRDEGGTLTLLGQRVLNGEVPFRDVDLGYNVGWFLPIAGLFKITGVDFVALRIFMVDRVPIAIGRQLRYQLRVRRCTGFERSTGTTMT